MKIDFLDKDNKKWIVMMEHIDHPAILYSGETMVSLMIALSEDGERIRSRWSVGERHLYKINDQFDSNESRENAILPIYSFDTDYMI